MHLPISSFSFFLICSFHIFILAYVPSVYISFLTHLFLFSVFRYPGLLSRLSTRSLHKVLYFSRRLHIVVVSRCHLSFILSSPRLSLSSIYSSFPKSYILHFQVPPQSRTTHLMLQFSPTPWSSSWAYTHLIFLSLIPFSKTQAAYSVLMFSLLLRSFFWSIIIIMLWFSLYFSYVFSLSFHVHSP